MAHRDSYVYSNLAEDAPQRYFLRNRRRRYILILILLVLGIAFASLLIFAETSTFQVLPRISYLSNHLTTHSLDLSDPVTNNPSSDRQTQTTFPSQTSAPAPLETMTSGLAESFNFDWSRFAYSQYATNEERLCHSLMIFESLHRLGSKADRVLMYPNTWQNEPANSRIQRLLAKARDSYQVKPAPVHVIHSMVGSATWADSFTKLLAFNLTQYERILNVDSDATILQLMDELFLSPPTLIAMPRAYWLDPNDRVLSSQMMLIQPTDAEFQRLMKATERDINNANGKIIGDMDIVSDLYKDSGMILPHRPYNLLTGEFRAESHTKYLGNSEEAWDADRVLKEAKFVHFSDWPYPKPWIIPPSRLPVDRIPKCVPGDCRDREIWLWFYDDFKQRMQRICSV